MFSTIDSFTTFYLSLSAILVLLVLFEKQCLALEDKIDAKIKNRKEKKR